MLEILLAGRHIDLKIVAVRFNNTLDLSCNLILIFCYCCNFEQIANLFLTISHTFLCESFSLLKYCYDFVNSKKLCSIGKSEKSCVTFLDDIL